MQEEDIIEKRDDAGDIEDRDDAERGHYKREE